MALSDEEERAEAYRLQQERRAQDRVQRHLGLRAPSAPLLGLLERTWALRGLRFLDGSRER